MQPPVPAKLLRLYDKGHITLMELHTGLVQGAASHPPKEIALLLTAELLQAIRDIAASPPTSPQGSPRIFHMGSWVGPFNLEAQVREEHQLWYDGVWQWHRYIEGCPAEQNSTAEGDVDTDPS
jgi:hypothetical protein